MELQTKVTSFGIENSPRITSNEYFMGIAILIEKQSEKGCYPVGACIVNSDQKIVGTGYNTLHKGWNKNKDVRKHFVYHAEEAILNTTSMDVKGCTMYVTLFPCKTCAKRIISSGIKKIIYCDMSRNYLYIPKSVKAAKQLFAANGVIFKECTTIYNKLVPEAYHRYSRLTNEECFMGIAYLSSKQSENIEKIGACIVNNKNVIVGVGYNSLSRKMDQISFNSLQKNIPASYFRDCTMYVTSFPYNESTKVIVQSGIKTIIYLHKNTDDKTEAAKKMFDADSVKYIQSNVKISNMEIFRSKITKNLNVAKTEQINEDKKITHSFVDICQQISIIIIAFYLFVTYIHIWFLLFIVLYIIYIYFI